MTKIISSDFEFVPHYNMDTRVFQRMLVRDTKGVHCFQITSKEQAVKLAENMSIVVDFFEAKPKLPLPITRPILKG